MLFDFTAPLFADSDEKTLLKNGEVVSEETVYVVDDKGKNIPIVIQEVFQSEEDKLLSENENRQTRGWEQEHEIGEKKTYIVRISNEAMGLPSFVTGAPITSAAKKKAGKIVAKVIGKKIGYNFVPGLNVISWVVGGFAFINGVAGNKGIKVRVSLVYDSTYVYEGGMYFYGWDIDDLTIKTY